MLIFCCCFSSVIIYFSFVSFHYKATKPNIIQSHVLCVIERKIMFNFIKLYIFTFCQLYNLLPCSYKMTALSKIHTRKKNQNYLSCFLICEKRNHFVPFEMAFKMTFMMKSFVMSCTLFRMVFSFCVCVLFSIILLCNLDDIFVIVC